MNPIPQKIYPLNEEDSFHEKLENLSQRTLFKRHLIVKDHIGLERTNFLTLFWEKFKGMFGYENRTDSRLVEYKTLQFIYEGRKWINRDKDLASVRALAQRVGLTPANKPGSKNGHLALQHLVDAIGRRVTENQGLNKPEDLSEEDLSRIADEYVKEFEELKKVPLFSHELSPFLQEICKTGKIFQETFPKPSIEEEKKVGTEEEQVSEEGGGGAATTGQDSDTPNKGATPLPQNTPVLNSDVTMTTENPREGDPATGPLPPLNERRTDSPLDLNPVAHLLDPKNQEISTPESAPAPEKPAPTPLATPSQGSLILRRTSVPVVPIDQNKPSRLTTAAQVAGGVALGALALGLIARASYGNGQFIPPQNVTDLSSLPDGLPTAPIGQVNTDAAAAWVGRNVTWINLGNVQKGSNESFPYQVGWPITDPADTTEPTSNVLIPVDQNAIKQALLGSQQSSSSAFNVTKEKNESDSQSPKNETQTLEPTADPVAFPAGDAASGETKDSVDFLQAPGSPLESGEVLQDLGLATQEKHSNIATINPFEGEILEEVVVPQNPSNSTNGTVQPGPDSVEDQGGGDNDAESRAGNQQQSPAISAEVRENEENPISGAGLHLNDEAPGKGTDNPGKIERESFKVNKMAVGVLGGFGFVAAIGAAFALRGKKDSEQTPPIQNAEEEAKKQAAETRAAAETLAAGQAQAAEQAQAAAAEAAAAEAAAAEAAEQARLAAEQAQAAEARAAAEQAQFVREQEALKAALAQQQAAVQVPLAGSEEVQKGSHQKIAFEEFLGRLQRVQRQAQSSVTSIKTQQEFEKDKKAYRLNKLAAIDPQTGKTPFPEIEKATFISISKDGDFKTRAIALALRHHFYQDNWSGSHILEALTSIDTSKNSEQEKIKLNELLEIVKANVKILSQVDWLDHSSYQLRSDFDGAMNALIKAASTFYWLANFRAFHDSYLPKRALSTEVKKMNKSITQYLLENSHLSHGNLADAYAMQALFNIPLAWLAPGKDLEKLSDSKESLTYCLLTDGEEAHLAIRPYTTQVGIPNKSNACYRNASNQMLFNTPCFAQLLMQELKKGERETEEEFQQRQAIKADLIALRQKIAENAHPKEIQAAEEKFRNRLFGSHIHGEFHLIPENLQTKWSSQQREQILQDLNMQYAVPSREAIEENLCKKYGRNTLRAILNTLYLQFDGASYFEAIFDVLNYHYQSQETIYTEDGNRPGVTQPLPMIQISLEKSNTQALHLQSLVDHRFSGEMFSGENQVRGHTVCVKNDRIISKPQEVVVIHAKRRQFDPATNRNFFDDRKITFPDDGRIDFSKAHNLREGALTYEVTSFLLWKAAAEGGHYTSYVKQENQWYCYDDETVTLIDENVAKEIMPDGYVFFFEKKEDHSDEEHYQNDRAEEQAIYERLEQASNVSSAGAPESQPSQEDRQFQEDPEFAQALAAIAALEAAEAAPSLANGAQKTGAAQPLSSGDFPQVSEEQDARLASGSHGSVKFVELDLQQRIDQGKNAILRLKLTFPEPQEKGPPVETEIDLGAYQQFISRKPCDVKKVYSTILKLTHALDGRIKEQSQRDEPEMMSYHNALVALEAVKQDLFQHEFKSITNESIRTIFNEIQGIVGHKSDIPIDFKIALLTFLKATELKENPLNLDGFKKINVYIKCLKQLKKTAGTDSEEKQQVFTVLQQIFIIDIQGVATDFFGNRGYDDKSQEALIKGIQDLNTFLLAKTGAYFNSQFITDSIELALNGETSQAKRESGAVENEKALSGFLLPEERELAQQGFRSWDDYSLKVKNEWRTERNDQRLLIHWIGTFCSKNEDGTYTSSTSDGTIDFTGLGELTEDQEKKALHFLWDYCQKPQVMRDKFKKPINKIPETYQSLKLMFNSDENFWKQSDQGTPNPYADIEEKFRALVKACDRFAKTIDDAMIQAFVDRSENMDGYNYDPTIDPDAQGFEVVDGSDKIPRSPEKSRFSRLFSPYFGRQRNGSPGAMVRSNDPKAISHKKKRKKKGLKRDLE